MGLLGYRHLALLTLEWHGLILIFTVPVGTFRRKLRAAGFYAEWKNKYGDDAWRVLEGSVGALS